jgi:hypothetical protein
MMGTWCENLGYCYTSGIIGIGVFAGSGSFLHLNWDASMHVVIRAGFGQGWRAGAIYLCKTWIAGDSICYPYGAVWIWMLRLAPKADMREFDSVGNLEGLQLVAIMAGESIWQENLYACKECQHV